MAKFEWFSGNRWVRGAFRVGVLILAVVVLQPQRSAGEPSQNGKGPPPSDLSVTTEILDLDSGGRMSTISSDGLGVYQNNVDGVSSILTANVCNGLTWGDWRFDSVGSTRDVTDSFFAEDAIQSSDPLYQAPANPPYWGPQLQQPVMNVQCTCTAHQNMYTMTAGQTFKCPLINHWTDSSGNQWSLAPDHSFYGAPPETTDAQVTCNSVSGGHCVEWFIDPIGAPANEAVGRLVETPNCRHCGKVDDGDFYMRFRIHVTLP
ncbi:MAG TPA: hypothetical protein VJA66_16345 [Thermoanaerobaculia bacterium]